MNIIPQAWVDTIMNKIQSINVDENNTDVSEGGGFIKNIGFIILGAIGVVLIIVLVIILATLAKKF